MQQRIGIIGAGLTGLTLAQQLRAAGHEAQLFDKGRTAGGRAATRVVEALALNHGPSGFEVSADFDHAVFRQWAQAGLISQQSPSNFRIVGAASALPTFLSSDLDIRVSMEISNIVRRGAQWHLTARDHEGERHSFGGFDQLILTCPAPQAAKLLRPLNLLPEELFERAVYRPQWTMMALFAEDIVLDGQISGAFDRIDVVERRGVVVQASEAWTMANLSLEKPDAAEALLRALSEIAPNLPATTYLRGHRWLYGGAISGPAERAVYLDDVGLGLAGDWLGPTGSIKTGIETALRSADAMATALLPFHGSGAAA